jgi:hypothetical protein
MLLLGGLAAAVLIIATALILAMALGDETTTAAPGVGGGGLDASTDGSAAGENRDSLVLSPTGVLGGATDPVGAGVETACAMFHGGATVDDFAIWFRADIGSVGGAEEEMFREILLEALTEECPEVLATED